MLKRVWDLEEDKLIKNADVRDVIFITHKWAEDEIEYNNFEIPSFWTKNSISGKSEKLHLIREAIRPHARYVWMDTICIDKSNMAELDEAIRSMYKWYSNCQAVVLDSGTTLYDWKSRGWC
jgi:hypothetical protein